MMPLHAGEATGLAMAGTAKAAIAPWKRKDIQLATGKPAKAEINQSPVCDRATHGIASGKTRAGGRPDLEAKGRRS